MMSLIWGHLLHDVLLFFASSYSSNPSDAQKESMNLFLVHCFANLPCTDPCGIEASKYIHNHPFDVSSRETLLKDYVKFHNYLNEKDGKRSDWTVLEALAAAHLRHGSNIRALGRSDQIRVEDHKMMQELIQENNKLREKLGLPWEKDNQFESGANWKKDKEKPDYDFAKHFKPYNGSEDPMVDISTIAIIVFSLIIFFVFIMACTSK
jgi:hypothetical protein